MDRAVVIRATAAIITEACRRRLHGPWKKPREFSRVQQSRVNDRLSAIIDHELHNGEYL